MTAMNFAWTLLTTEPTFEVQQYLNMTPGALSELSPDETDHAQRLLMNYFMQQRGQGTGMEGVAIGTGTSTGDSMQPSSQVEKYDTSTYNQPGQALPEGQMPPKDPEMARGSRQQSTMEAGAERGRMKYQREKARGEMEEAGMTQETMGDLRC